MFQLLRDRFHRLGGAELTALGLLAVVILLAALGEPARVALRYDRAALGDGEWWRLIGGHLVHLGWRHAILDAAAALVIAGLFGPTFRPARWAWILAASLVAVNAGLWWLSPEVGWYVGLSGVLHGAVGAAAVGWIATGRPGGYWLVTGLALKLAAEQAFGPLWLTGAAAGGPVIVDAHLYGTVGGTLAALVPRGPHTAAIIRR
jgi:rhomboid family GlyGly-CTERM serine protease